VGRELVRAGAGARAWITKPLKTDHFFYFQQNWSGSVLKTDQFFIKKTKLITVAK
jgi:hypothetical protein